MTIAQFQHVSTKQFLHDAKGLANLLAVDNIPLPARATSGSAGYDFTASCDLTIEPGESATIPTGIRARMEQGWVLLLFPRSSLGFKHGIRLANTVGVIDSDYYFADNEGHILVKLVNGGDHSVTIHAGERFCQGVFLPYGLAEEDQATETRKGGIGSTGV